MRKFKTMKYHFKQCEDKEEVANDLILPKKTPPSMLLRNCCNTNARPWIFDGSKMC